MGRLAVRNNIVSYGNVINHPIHTSQSLLTQRNPPPSPGTNASIGTSWLIVALQHTISDLVREQAQDNSNLGYLCPMPKTVGDFFEFPHTVLVAFIPFLS